MPYAQNAKQISATTIKMLNKKIYIYNKLTVSLMSLYFIHLMRAAMDCKFR